MKSKEPAIKFQIWIQPGASNTAWAGSYGDPPIPKLRVASPPIDGRANEEVLRFIQKEFKGVVAHIEMIAGFKSKRKEFEIYGCTKDQLLNCLKMRQKK